MYKIESLPILIRQNRKEPKKLVNILNLFFQKVTNQ